MFGSIRVCVPFNFFFLFYFVFVFSSVYVMSLNMAIFTFYVCLHVCACSYATCMWPEF